MRPIHVAGFAQLPQVAHENGLDEAEMVREVCTAALADAGVARSDVGFVCSGSSDYAMGRPFSFTMALDGVAPWPPIRESHVESDGAYALYEAWVRLQHGDVDVALVYAYGKSTHGDVDRVMTMQLDPYTEAPLGIGPMALAALQARVLLEQGRISERELAEIVREARIAGAANPNAPTLEVPDVDALLAAPYVASPLRAHDGPHRTDGAAAIVLRAGGGGPRIAGIAHRIEAMSPGLRDLSVARSAALAAAAAGGCAGVEIAELDAPYASQLGLVRDALGLGPSVRVNRSGGTLVACTPMVSGLIRIGEAALGVRAGAARAVATSTAGPCLQQNLVCVLEEAR